MVPDPPSLENPFTSPTILTKITAMITPNPLRIPARSPEVSTLVVATGAVEEAAGGGIILGSAILGKSCMGVGCNDYRGKTKANRQLN